MSDKPTTPKGGPFGDPEWHARNVEMLSAGATPEPVAAPLVGTGEMVLLPRALAEEMHGDLCELRAEWQWKKDEPRAGNAREYAALVTRLDKLGAILHGQENVPAQPRDQ